MAGILTRETVLALAVVLAILVAAFVPRTRELAEPDSIPPGTAPDEPWARRLSFATAGALTIWCLAAVAAVIDLPLTSADAANFHLPTVVTWMQQQSIWEVAQLLPQQANGYYPHNGNVLLLAVVLPWENDFLARVPSVAMLALGGVATYSAARELRADSAASTLVAAALVAVPIHTQGAIERGLPDAFMLATLAIGVLFLLRHARNDRLAELVVAGAALGLALGSRWHGVSAVVLIFAVWFVARMWTRSSRRVFRDAAVLGGLVAVGGGVWLLRNWILTGNPIFPAPVSLFGLRVFDAPPDPLREQLGFTLAHYAGDWQILRSTILPGLRDALALPALTIAALGLAGAMHNGTRWASRLGVDRRVLACAAAAVAVAIAYLFTPYSALGREGEPFGVAVNARYVMPALVLFAPPAALLVSTAGQWRLPLQLLLLSAVIHGLALGVDTDAAPLVASTLLVGGTYIAARSGLLTRAAKLALGGGVRTAAAGGLILAICALAFYVLQERAANFRYLGAEPALDLILTHDSRQSVALAGTWTPSDLQPPLPAFGPSLENEVEYLARDVEGLPKPYRRRREFEAALRSADPDVLILGLSTVRSDPVELKRWIQGAGYRPASGSARLVAYVPG